MTPADRSIRLRVVDAPVWTAGNPGSRPLAAPGSTWYATLTGNGTREPTGRWAAYPDGPAGTRMDLVIARVHRVLTVRPILIVLPGGTVWCPHSVGPDGQTWSVLGGIGRGDRLSVPQTVHEGAWRGFVWDGVICELPPERGENGAG